MATTMYLETTLRDKGDEAKALDIEVGTSSYYSGERLLYLVVDGRTVILDHEAGKRLCEAFADIAGYLGYDR